MIELTHSFDPSQFIWLWSKYVTGLNDRYHCTNCIRGRYSKKFTRLNPDFTVTGPIVMNEEPAPSFKAIRHFSRQNQRPSSELGNRRAED